MQMKRSITGINHWVRALASSQNYLYGGSFQMLKVFCCTLPRCWLLHLFLRPTLNFAPAFVDALFAKKKKKKTTPDLAKVLYINVLYIFHASGAEDGWSCLEIHSNGSKWFRVERVEKKTDEGRNL